MTTSSLTVPGATGEVSIDKVTGIRPGVQHVNESRLVIQLWSQAIAHCAKSDLSADQFSMVSKAVLEGNVPQQLHMVFVLEVRF